MTDPIDPIRGARGPNPTRRSGRDRRQETEAAERADLSLPVPVDAPHAEPEPERTPDVAFEAQLLGQGGQKKGLKGGKEVLDHAREAYLGTEYSGAADRRPKPGLVKKTEI